MKSNRMLFLGLIWCMGLMVSFSCGSIALATNDALVQPDVDVFFVLDNSGSMIKNDPDFITKTVVINFLEGLSEKIRIGMVIFDEDAHLIESLSNITTAASAERFLASLDMITYKGQFTNTPAGVERAVYELKNTSRPEAEKILILLTDGIVDTGNKDQDLEAEKWLKEMLTLECRKLGIRIFGIAFTEGADFQLIQTLAVNTDGEYFRAFSTEDIETIFQKINNIISRPAHTVSTSPETTVRSPSQPDEQTGVNQPPVASNPPPSAEKTSSNFLLLLMLIVAAGMVFIYVVFMRRRKKILIVPDPQVDVHKGEELPERPMDPAELIDTESVISNESLTLPLDRKTVSIGRDSSNDIVIPKESISSLHATIDYKNGYYYIEDHRSTNGTRLNDKTIKENNPVRLKSGDKIHFAIYEFRFLMHDLAPYGETVMIKKDTELKFQK